jgi:hypothetical protein
MPTNLLLLPLLGGFWFMLFCHYFHFRAQQLEGYRLLLYSAFAGVGFFGMARILTWYLQSIPWVSAPKEVWHEIAPVEFAGTGRRIPEPRRFDLAYANAPPANSSSS